VKESNVSNISKALAVVTLLAPVPGLPLSIGDIQLHSALNQSLNAEIRLQLDGGESPADVSVRMASPEKFDKAGIPWSYFLTKVKFDLLVLSDGSINVKLTSRESLTEPFLDFLLEVSWSQGSQYREFTLLIDPPAEYKTTNLPLAENTAYRSEPVYAYSAARPERKVHHAVERVIRPAVTNQNKSQIATSGEFGPVKKNDNLWKIATELSKERGISSAQMMSELYNANPEAFYHNDPNALKAGVILKIPVGNPGQHPASTANEQNNIPQESAGTEKPLKLIAPGETKVADNGEVYGAGGQAKAGRANDQTALGDNGKATEAKSLELQARVENLERQLNMMQQLLALKDQQLSQLQNSKVQPNSPAPVPAAPQLPVEVAPPVAQPLVPPVAPQNVAPTPPVNAEPQTPPPVVAPVAPEVKPVAPTPVAPPVAAVAPKPAPQVPATPVAAEEGFISSDSYYIAVATFGTSVLGVLGWLLWRKRRIDEQTYTESMFASASQITMPESESTLTVPVMELESPVTYDVGTVGESSFISDFTPSDFDAFDTDQNEIDPLSEADVYLAYGRYQQAEELIRNALNHEPGRDTYKLKLLEIYYAAENKDAFAKYSEVLAKDGKESDRGFWNKVSEMGKELVPESALFGGAPAAAPIKTARTVNVAKTVNTDLVKQKAPSASTGLESLLDNDYLAALDSSLALDTAIPEDLSNEFSDLKQAFSKASNQQIDQLDFDFGSPEAKFGITDADLDEMTLKFSADSEMPEGIRVDYAEYKFDTIQEKSADNDQGLDLAALSKDSENQKPAAIEPTANNEAIDFDLSSFSFDSLAEHAKDADHDNDLETFNFNFDIDEIKKPSTQEVSEIILTPETHSLEIAENHNLSVNSTFDPDISALQAIKPDALEEDSFSEFDFSFDFDTPVENKDSEFSKDSEFFDLNVSDLTDMDEYETKIDLAKAYVDMGDASAAKMIAEEVLGKGTRDQKLAAQALLDELR